MKTKVIRMNPQELDMEGIREAGEILRQGGLVAFPTETVYGLGGNGLDPQASAKIYRAKGRPSDNPYGRSGENCKRGAGECKKTGISLLAGTIDNDFSEKRYCAL